MDIENPHGDTRHEDPAIPSHRTESFSSDPSLLHPHLPPFWILPIVSASIWFSTLWILLIFWLSTGRQHYISMSPIQQIPYISDIGADTLRPLFTAGCAITALSFFLCLCATRFNHALIRTLEKTFDGLSIAAGLLGSVSLLLLALFDTVRAETLHRLFLALFMIGIVFSALFTTVEFRRLGRTFSERRVLQRSYRFKQGVVVLEVALSVTFGVLMGRKRHNAAAVVEWGIAFIFTGYLASFFFDLRPQSQTKGDPTAVQLMREREQSRERRLREGRGAEWLGIQQQPQQV